MDGQLIRTTYTAERAIVHLVLLFLFDGVSGLTCNLCNNADLMEDCFINHEVCRADYVCFIEIQYFTLTKNDYSTKTMKLYSMGCQHFHLCRDRRTHGPGAYGYGTQEYQCCCTDFCHEPDGVGLGRHDLCPALWKNRTIPSANGCGRTMDALVHSTRLWWSLIVAFVLQAVICTR